MWSRDSARIVFASQRSGVNNLYTQAADGTGSVERLAEGRSPHLPIGITPDGRGVVVREQAAQGGSDLLLVPLSPSDATGGAARTLVRTMFNETNGEVSPDGRWQVSTGGGRSPLWSRDGRELFYRSVEGGVLGVRVEPGSAWRSSQPAAVISGRYFDITGAGHRTFDVAADGRRFMMIKEGAGGDVALQNLVVVQHWFEELKRLVPAD